MENNGVVKYKNIDNPYNIKSLSNFKKNIFESRIKNNRSINVSKMSNNNSYNNSYLSEKEKKIQLNKIISQRIYFSRNRIKIHYRPNKIQSALFKKPKSTNTNFYSVNIKNKTPKNLLYQKNCSAYYINMNSSLKDKYISDLLLSKDENIKNKTQKLSDIEKKIGKIELKLNLKNIKNIIKANLLINNSRKKNKKEKERNLPDYLKDKYNIKGTNILSPFCLKAKYQFVMKKFRSFLDKTKLLKTDKTDLVDNKLNIVYAENEDIYKNKLKKINMNLIKKGKREKHKLLNSPSDKQLRDIAKEVTLMKKVINFAYPNTTMIKIKDNKEYFKKNKTFYKKFESLNNIKNFEDSKNDFYELRFK